MRNLLNFIVRNSSWLLAILLIALSFYLIFSQNSYQRSVYLTSANRVTGELYRISDNISSLFLMKKNNDDLLSRNASLQKEIIDLKNQIVGLSSDSIHTDALVSDSVAISQFSFIPANVVNMSYSGVNNFLTLDKGARDGIKPDMGVISQQGVVGVILNTSEYFSVVIPVINPKFRLSAKLKNSENSGSVAWDGRSLKIAQLEQLPKHEVFNEGDTVVTSFSRIFPKDLVIGYTVDKGKSRDDNFNTFNIRLATNFYSIQHVLIISDIFYDEQSSLEKTVEQ